MVAQASKNECINDHVEQEPASDKVEEGAAIELPSSKVESVKAPVEESPAKAAPEDDIEAEDIIDLDDTEMESPLPEDIFSLIYVSEHMGYSFFYSLIVYILQMTLIVLILLDLLDFDSDTNVLKIPPGVDLEVTIAQGISMVLAVATQTNLLTAVSRLSMRSSYDHKYVASHITPFATLQDYTVGVVLQLLSGIVMLIDNFILNMQVSHTRRSLIENYVAMSRLPNGLTTSLLLLW